MLAYEPMNREDLEACAMRAAEAFCVNAYS